MEDDTLVVRPRLNQLPRVEAAQIYTALQALNILSVDFKIDKGYNPDFSYFEYVLHEDDSFEEKLDKMTKYMQIRLPSMTLTNLDPDVDDEDEMLNRTVKVTYTYNCTSKD
jgi:hypothetical protein